MTENWLDKIKGKHILVLGDLIVDKYIIGRVERISPEAPIPVVNQERTDHRPGGAANVALNLQQLGVLPSLISVTGNDDTQSTIIAQLDFLHNREQALVAVPGRITTCKTRVMANLHHIVRIDHEETTPITDETTSEILRRATELHQNQPISAVILQDYEKGFFHPGNIPLFISWAKENNIPVLVDPKDRNFWLYKGVDVFKPNRNETEKALGSRIALNADGGKLAHESLHARLQHQLTALTLSDQGIYLQDAAGYTWDQPDKRDIVDVCGAGDAVIAILAALYSVNAPQNVLARMANIAGGIVCERPGVAPVDSTELLKEYNQQFI